MPVPIHTLGVVGTIGSGKTTWLNLFQKYIAARFPRIAVIRVDEPVQAWIDSGIFQLFTRRRRFFGAILQRETLSSRIVAWHKMWERAEAEAARNDIDCVIVVLERTPYCDRYMFAENLFEIGDMDAREIKQYREWYEYLMEKVPAPIELIVWINVPWEETVRRVKERDRDGEKNYDEAYLRGLWERHTAALSGGSYESIPVRSLDGALAFHSSPDLFREMAHIVLDDIKCPV